jgi:hypothetical protein
MATKTKKKAAATPPQPVEPESREAVLAAIVKLCDRFDRQMLETRGETMNLAFGHYGRNTPMGDLRDEMRALDIVLDKFLTAEEDAQDIVLKAISIEPGIVPTWSRAGTFLIWMGKTPFRCEWGGFPYPYASFAAADPRMPFPSSDGVMRCTTVIERMQRTPADVCRSDLLVSSQRISWRRNKKEPTFSFVPLDPATRADVTSYRDSNEWLRKAIAKGPVEPIPMPDHLHAIPLALAF